MKQNTIFTLLLVLAAGYFLGNFTYTYTHNAEHIHYCRWDDCPMYGENHFISEYEPGTDGYYWDTLHYQYPDKGYEAIEEEVMGY